jgi:hypothetical protein
LVVDIEIDVLEGITAEGINQRLQNTAIAGSETRLFESGHRVIAPRELWKGTETATKSYFLLCRG